MRSLILLNTVVLSRTAFVDPFGLCVNFQRIVLSFSFLKAGLTAGVGSFTAVLNKWLMLVITVET